MKLSVSKAALSDKTLCAAVVSRYLSLDKPLASEVAEELKTTEHNVQAVLKQELSTQQWKEERALRWSRAKVGQKNPMSGKTAEKHHNFKGRLTCDPDGYILVLKPHWYMGRADSKHVYEHQVIMAQMLGLSEVPEGMCVHHIDEDKTNNDPNNLALVTAEGHQRLHGRSPLRRLSLWELHRSGTSRLKPTTAMSHTG
jgi:hypothetical protein